MTDNDSAAHEKAYIDTSKIRTVVARTSAVYRLAKIAFEEAETQCDEAYCIAYETELAKLESNDDAE
jgi:hypothetical protein